MISLLDAYKNVCSNCDKKGKCFFQRNRLVCKKLLDIHKQQVKEA